MAAWLRKTYSDHVEITTMESHNFTQERRVCVEDSRMLPKFMATFKGVVRHVRSVLGLLVRNPYRRGMIGHIDGVYFGSLRGWAKTKDGTALTLLVKKNNVCIGQCKANGARADLAAKGFGDGRFGFALPLPPDMTIDEGDILEVVDATAPSRSMAVRITRQMAARPVWKYRGQKFEEPGKRSQQYAEETGKMSSENVQVLDETDTDLAAAYKRVVIQNRDLQATVARCEAEMHLNRLQLRQAQEELEHWYLKYLDLQAAAEAISEKRLDG